MKLLRVIATIGLTAGVVFPAAAADVITGAGSTFVYPLLAQWSTAARQAIGVAVDYRPTGSGSGIHRIVNKTVTFAATDMPLTQGDIQTSHLVQFPLVNGAVVPVFNLPGIAPGALVLNGPTIAKIFLGAIERWDDPAIASLNSHLALPHTAITVVHRSDASGTTFIWTDYLSKVSLDWQEKVGEDLIVDWPAGIGAKGNVGVSTDVARTVGALGYVEYAYAEHSNLSYVRMVNRAGSAVAPTPASFRAAAAGTDWGSVPDFRVVMTNAPGEASWPIAGSTFILMDAVPLDVASASRALRFFDWGYRQGSSVAASLGYVPMPGSAVALIEKLWDRKINTAGGAPVFKP